MKPKAGLIRHTRFASCADVGELPHKRRVAIQPVPRAPTKTVQRKNAPPGQAPFGVRVGHFCGDRGTVGACVRQGPKVKGNFAAVSWQSHRRDRSAHDTP